MHVHYVYVRVGHVKRLLRGIGEMTELMKGRPSFLSPVRAPMSQTTLESLLPPPSPLSAQPTEPSHHTPAPDESERGDFSQLEMNMGANSVPKENSDKHTIGDSSLPSTSHTVAPRQSDQHPVSPQESLQPTPQLPPQRDCKFPSREASGGV